MKNKRILMFAILLALFAGVAVSAKNTLKFRYSIVTSNSALLEQRYSVKRIVIAPPNLVKLGTTTGTKDTSLSANIYGIETRGKLTKTSNSDADCLKVYIQGHGGDPMDFDYHNELRDYFLSQGCDVLSLSMLGLGLNKGAVEFPTRQGKIVLNEEQSRNHGNYSFFFDPKHPDLDPLAIFLSPHYYLLESLKNDYEQITLMGISGGGWYTVWLSALLPEIDMSISYAGSLPFRYRIHSQNHGDWEQIYSKAYDLIDYYGLYTLMTIDKFGSSNRSTYLVFNDDDNCCFMDPFASSFKYEIDAREIPNLSVVIDKSSSHSMNVELTKSLDAK